MTWGDLRPLASIVAFATRRLRRDPSAVLLVVAVLAVTIGSSTAVYRWVDTVLFRPLPVSQGEDVIRIFTTFSDHPDRINSVSHPLYRTLDREASTLSGLAAFTHGNSLQVSTAGSDPARVRGSLVSSSYFPLLGVRPERGRLLTPDDDLAGTEPVVVLSHRFWKERLGGSESSLEERLTINGHPFSVVGVTPPGFVGDSLDAAPDLYLPLATVELAHPAFRSFDVLENPDFVWLGLLARRTAGAGPGAVAAELDGILARLEERMSLGDRARVFSLDETPMHPHDLPRLERLSWILLALVGLMLGLGCSVAASLLLVRGERLRRDLAIRSSLGAPRSRLVGELVAEGAVTALVAGVLGVAIAFALDRFALGAWGSTLLVPSEGLDPLLGSRMLLTTIAATAVTVLAGSLIPAWRCTEVDPGEALQASSSRSSSRNAPLRSGLVVAQVALATVVLVGAGLLLRTLDRARSQDPGFPLGRGLVASVDLARQGYERDEWVPTLERLEASVRSIPGVRRVGLSQHVPVHPGGSRITVAPEGYVPGPDENTAVHLTVAGPGFLEALGSRVLEGRLLREQDRDAAAPVVVVNRAFVDRFWPGRSGLGKTIADFGGKQVEVVGVIEDFKLRSLREAPVPAAYAPLGQFPVASVSLLLRTSADPTAVIADLRAAVASVDPTLPVFDVATLRAHVGSTLAGEEDLARLVSVFAGVALLMALAGLYGVLAYVTETRRREIGIRMAVGAERGRVIVQVLRRGITLGLAGVAAGSLAALALGRFLESLLFQVRAHDPWTLGAVALILLSLSVGAAAVPARRAAAVDPMTILREE